MSKTSLTKKIDERYCVCPLCGNRFRGSEAVTCQACSKLHSCRLIMCPKCGYEFPRTDHAPADHT